MRANRSEATNEEKAAAADEGGRKKKNLDPQKNLLCLLTLLANTASADTLSKSANWSPMHLRLPPPKGRYEKDSVISFGTTYEEEEGDEAEAEAAEGDGGLPL